jgi:pimeloyl-ACP methyl ester carboxylesterase
VGDYRVELLAADAVGLIRHLGHSRAAAVVGHDWGGIVAWFAAMHQPAALERLVILNAPHPQAYLRELRRSRQALLSWYAFAFQIPGLPERLIRRRDFRAVRELLRTDPADRAAFTEADIDEYVRALAQPGALTASINYYRAAFRRGHAGVAQAVRRIDAETLLIWGERDRFLVPSLTEGLDAWVPRLTVKRLPHATHWVHHDAGEVVNGMLIDFLRGRAR